MYNIFIIWKYDTTEIYNNKQAINISSTMMCSHHKTFPLCVTFLLVYINIYCVCFFTFTIDTVYIL